MSRSLSSRRRILLGIKSEGYQPVGYEPMQGFQVYASHQLSYVDLSEVSSRLDAFCPGIDLFPRPNLELRGEFVKRGMLVASPRYADCAWLLIHCYFEVVTLNVGELRTPNSIGSYCTC